MPNFQGAINGQVFTFRQSVMDGNALEFDRESKNHDTIFQAKSQNRYGSLFVDRRRNFSWHFEVNIGDFSGLFQELNLDMAGPFVPSVRNYPTRWDIPESWRPYGDFKPIKLAWDPVVVAQSQIYWCATGRGVQQIFSIFPQFSAPTVVNWP